MTSFETIGSGVPNIPPTEAYRGVEQAPQVGKPGELDVPSITTLPSAETSVPGIKTLPPAIEAMQQPSTEQPQLGAPEAAPDSPTTAERSSRLRKLGVGLGVAALGTVVALANTKGSHISLDGIGEGSPVLGSMAFGIPRRRKPVQEDADFHTDRARGALESRGYVHGDPTVDPTTSAPANPYDPMAKWAASHRTRRLGDTGDPALDRGDIRTNYTTGIQENRANHTEATILSKDGSLVTTGPERPVPQAAPRPVATTIGQRMAGERHQQRGDRLSKISMRMELLSEGVAHDFHIHHLGDKQQLKQELAATRMTPSQRSTIRKDGREYRRLAKEADRIQDRLQQAADGDDIPSKYIRFRRR